MSPFSCMSKMSDTIQNSYKHSNENVGLLAIKNPNQKNGQSARIKNWQKI